MRRTFQKLWTEARWYVAQELIALAMRMVAKEMSLRTGLLFAEMFKAFSPDSNRTA